MALMLRMFNKAGATGYVFLIKGGEQASKGLGYAGLIGPWTTVAVAPTVDQACPFTVEARTKDNQAVSISGDVTVKFDPEAAAKAFDFTVDLRSGGYLNNWQALLNAAVIERVMGPLRIKAKSLEVADAVSAQEEFEQAIASALTVSASAGKLLQSKGVQYVTCSVAEVTSEDEEVAEAIGSTERQAMLSEADTAMHDRRIKAAQNERKVKTYESATALTLEKERAKLVDQQGENEKAKATTDAAAIETRLGPYKELDPGLLLAVSINKMAERGVSNLTIAPELLAAIKTAAK